VSIDISPPERKILHFFRTLHDRPSRPIANGSVFVSLSVQRFCTKRLLRFIPHYTGLHRLNPLRPRKYIVPSCPSSSKIGVMIAHPQLVPGSVKGQNLSNKSIADGAEADLQSSATGCRVLSSQHLHSVFYTRVLLSHTEITLPCSYPLCVPVRRRADPPPSVYLKNFCISNASLFLSIK
jgi:hypothetical protein